jgi:hypothetical protein
VGGCMGGCGAAGWVDGVWVADVLATVHTVWEGDCLVVAVQCAQWCVGAMPVVVLRCRLPGR